MDKTQKVLILVVTVVIIAILGFAAYAPHREKVTYNKFKDPNTPEASYMDALFADLRVTTK